jgi:hypothetical protein
MMATPKTDTFAKQKSGTIFASYAYVTGADTLKVKKISGGFHMMQVQSPQKQGAGYLFIDFLDNDQFIVLAPDMMGKGPYIEALVRKHAIVEAKRSGGTEPGTVNLGGTASKIVDFLTGHDKSMLTDLASCRRKL